MLKWLSACFVACALLSAPTNLAAQSYPTKPIRFIVPFTPGGQTDATARIIGEAMAEILGQPVVIENRPGAAATLGIDLVAKSKPDGYTVGISGVGATAIVPLIDPKLSYSPARDLDIIAGLMSVDGIVVASPTLKQNNMAELIEFARANPEKVTYSTAGIAGPSHLNFEYLQHLSGVKLLHVPYSGDVPAITAVLTGDVSVAVVASASAAPFLADGKLKSLGANGPGAARNKILPDVPSIVEQTGFTKYAPHTWSVLVAAKGTPAEYIDILNKAANQALAKPEVIAKLERLGLKPLSGDVTWAQELVRKETADKKAIIDLVGLRRE